MENVLRMGLFSKKDNRKRRSSAGSRKRQAESSGCSARSDI